jgi:hypothetical protein
MAEVMPSPPCPSGYLVVTTAIYAAGFGLVTLGARLRGRRGSRGSQGSRDSQVAGVDLARS